VKPAAAFLLFASILADTPAGVVFALAALAVAPIASAVASRIVR